MHAIHSQKTDSQPELTRQYEFVRSYTERLCALLEIEDYVLQPIPDVSPAKWNIAHTSWFFEQMILKKFAENYREFNPQFGFLFNSYYNTLGERTARDRRGDLSRPTVREVFAYRKYVDEKMREFLSGDLTAEARELVVLGLNHEQQHQELLLADLKYAFGCNPLFPVYEAENILEETGENEPRGFADIGGGIHEIGFCGDGFHFDNELGRHKVYLEDFLISKNLVTNGEFIEFIDAGGYANHALWHAEGFDWVDKNDVTAPLYWRKTNGEYFQFTLGGLRRVKPENAVCHVSFYEAAAFAEWKKMRLPTEFEWEAANSRFDWGLRWEWTNSAYLPYPNFARPAGAVGEYNGKFMINQMVLRGASVVTPPNHSRATYRNFFHPHLRWQFTGIRLAQQEINRRLRQ